LLEEDTMLPAHRLCLPYRPDLRLLTLSALATAGAALALTATGCGDGDISDPVGSGGASIIGGKSASAYPEAALVDLYQGEQLVGYCSGTVIAPRVALTAGHCVTGVDGWRVTTPFAGQQSATAGMAVTRYVSTGETVNPDAIDLALIFLDDSIQLDSYPTLATAALPDGSKVVDIGRIHGGKVTGTLYVSKAITVSDATDAGFPHDYVSTDVIEPGDSGGPVMAQGTHTVVAVNSGGGGGAEVLARVDVAASWLKSQIKAHGGASAGSGPGASSGSGSSASGGASGTRACAHDPCAAGARLARSCDPCVTSLCSADPYCCRSTWDDTCLQELAEVCPDRCQ
jgi:V8-like Glu-specific endopeptidase